MSGTQRRYLLDTNVLIMLSSETARIPRPVLDLLESFNSELYVSTLAFWELAIKQATGKLDTNIRFDAIFNKHEMRELILSARYTETLRTLELLHRDPFDRMLVAQAIAEKLTLVTSDRRLANYPVATLQV